MAQPIRIWAFKEAPTVLRELSRHGGDEDWIAEIPPVFGRDIPSWMSSLGCIVSEHSHPNKAGWWVRIWAHA